MDTAGQKRHRTWTRHLERALGQEINGEARQRVQAVLGAVYDEGLEAQNMPTEATGTPPVNSETSPGPDRRGEATKSTESHGELWQWWMDTAEAEIEPMLGKMVEYGGMSRATDLVAIGKSLVDAGVRVPEETDEVYTELGIWFYLRGKLARWEAAIKEGRRVSDDTLLDAGVYVRMAQRVRAAGGWPI